MRACAGASQNESEFVTRLRKHGLQVRPRYAEGGTIQVTGYSVRLAVGGDDRGRAVWYGGGRLARDLTLPALRRGWHQDRAVSERALDSWRSSAPARSATERRDEVEQRGLLWHRCTSEIERVRLQLRRAGTDQAACGHAAREGAAVLAAWSLELERDQPGALARASRQLARSAELPAHTPAARGQPSRASGLALMMLAAGQPDNPIGWVLVGREVGLLVREIGRAHRARGELDRAREIESRLHRELEEIRIQIDTEHPASVELDRETKAAKRATAPLDPPTRDARQDAGDGSDVEAVGRLIDPTRGRRHQRR